MTDTREEFILEHKNFRVDAEGDNDLKIIMSMIFRNWYWFLLTILVAMLAVRFYIRHTLPIYRTSATILINETENRPVVDNSELLQGLGLPGGMRNLENQIMILRSVALTEATLDELPYEVEFYTKGLRNRVPVYPVVPLRLESEGDLPLPRDTEFLIEYSGPNRFTIESQAEYFPFSKSASFGDSIDIQGGTFRIECRNEDWFKSNPGKQLYFTIHSRINLVNYFNKRINVQMMSKDGSVLIISMNGTNRAKDSDFLNKLLENFQSISLDKKNTEADRRIQFMENQLVGISDSLSLTENRLQQFRSSHQVMDLSAQGQSIITQVSALENERARLNLEANYYDYLADYLSKESSGEIPIIPITMGITDAGLTRLVEELAELQGQLSTRGAGQMNPLQRNLEQQVRNARAALRETLNGLRRANSLARSENQAQLNKANAQASSLPVTERQLLGIERKFRLNDELYTFLLETRAEQEMQKASNRADSEIIDGADPRFSTLISPNPIKLNLIGLIASLGITFLIIYLNVLYNNKLSEEDIRKITDLPIVGNIPHCAEKGNTIVFDDPQSTVSESFRILRSRLQFFTKESEAPVILVTSTMSEDGKTLLSMNLASVYSLLGKKTILVGFDLRKPKIFQDFKLSNDKGISTWLIGQDSLDDVIQKTAYDYLSIISSGPVPPNPSELTALEKTDQLFRRLKEEYDYIIIDSSPIGLVSDTFHLASIADALLLVARPGHTLKDMFIRTLHEISVSGIKSAGLIINDNQARGRKYAYGERYGYTSEKVKRKHLRIFRRK